MGLLRKKKILNLYTNTNLHWLLEYFIAAKQISPGKKTTIIGQSYARLSKTEAKKLCIPFTDI